MPLPATPLAVLLAAPPTVHPALALAWHLRERERELGGSLPVDELIPLALEIDRALAAVHTDRRATQRATKLLQAARPEPAHHVLLGF